MVRVIGRINKIDKAKIESLQPRGVKDISIYTKKAVTGNKYIVKVNFIMVAGKTKWALYDKRVSEFVFTSWE